MPLLLLKQMLSQLHLLLAENDGEAVDYLVEVAPRLAATLDRAALGGLRDQVETFQFDAALKRVEQIAAAHDIELRR